MQRMDSVWMLVMYVSVDFFFSVKDFAAFWTHVLSFSGVGGAFSFDYLTHLSCSNIV